MKLQRNSDSDKYILINRNKLQGPVTNVQELAAAILNNPAAVEFGGTGSPEEFFVIKLKDRYAPDGLRGYAGGIMLDDMQMGSEILAMSRRSGPRHPHCKRPD